MVKGCPKGTCNKKSDLKLQTISVQVQVLPALSAVLSMDSTDVNVNAPLLHQNGNDPPTYNSTEYEGLASPVEDSGTQRTPSPVPRTESMTERGRARTVSSIAPMPESCYTINMFLVFITFFQVMNLMTLTYTDSVLNYISKRFRIPNTMASFIPSSYQIGNMVIIIPVSFFGSRFNRPRVIAIGMVLMVAGLGCCALPHFLLPSPRYMNASNTELCHRGYSLHFEGKPNYQHVSDAKSASSYQGDVLASTTYLRCNANGSTYNPAVLLIVGEFSPNKRGPKYKYIS